MGCGLVNDSGLRGCRDTPLDCWGLGCSCVVGLRDGIGGRWFGVFGVVAVCSWF